MHQRVMPKVKISKTLLPLPLDQSADKRRAEDGRECSEVAIKELKKEKIVGTSMGLKSLLNEIRVHWALEQCEGVLQLLGIHEDDDNIYLILEYQPKGTLMGTLQEQSQVPESDVRMIME